jgi:hypothetical protein
MTGATVISPLVVAAGGLWSLAPRRFVSLYRKGFYAEPLPKTGEWERAAVSTSSRIIGAFLFVVGCMMLWTIYSPFIRGNLSQLR